MRTNVADIFGAGDVTSFPLTFRGDQQISIGHWQMSQAHGKRLKGSKIHPVSWFLSFCADISSWTCYSFNVITVFYSSLPGRVAALNMLKKPATIESVPFFWTALLGKSIRYTGRVFNVTLMLCLLVPNLTSHFLLLFSGYGEGYTEIIFKGKVEERKFLAFYIKWAAGQ